MLGEGGGGQLHFVEIGTFVSTILTRIVVKAHYQCRRLVETLNEVREEADEVLCGLLKRATDVTNANDIQISKPRTAGRQRHRENFSAETKEKHHRTNIWIPFNGSHSISFQ